MRLCRYRQLLSVHNVLCILYIPKYQIYRPIDKNRQDADDLKTEVCKMAVGVARKLWDGVGYRPSIRFKSVSCACTDDIVSAIRAAAANVSGRARNTRPVTPSLAISTTVGMDALTRR